MGLTRISGDVIQTPLNVGVVTATRIDGNVSGNVNSTGVSTFTTLRVGTAVTISGGIVTATSFVGNITGNVTGNATGLSGTPNITVGSITASSATITGNVSVAGTVTYDDVTNVDSLGVGTFRSGIVVNTGTATTALVVNGDARVTGILTVGQSSVTIDGTNNKITTPKLDYAGISSTITATAVDVFVYDTRKDSDGGAWRKRTQHTSWYNETLNTATRGSRREFPAVAVIVAETSSITIYDGDDPDLPMWMVFTSGYETYLGNTSGLTAVTMLNGVMVHGGSYDVHVANFIADKSNRYGDTSGITVNHRLPISGRNDTTAGNYNGPTSPSIVNRTVNDVAMTVLPNAPIDSATGLPIPTIAVATNGGVSVIKDDGTVVDITTSDAYDAYVKVNFDNNNRLYYCPNDTQVVYSQAIPSDDVNFGAYNTQDASRVMFPTMDHGGFPSNHPVKLLGTNGSTPFSIVGNKAFGSKETSYSPSGFGIRPGLTFIDEGNTNPTSSVAYATTSYNTGWMHGDIKGAFLSDTTVESLTANTNLATNATQSGTDRLTSETYDDGDTSWQMVDNAATDNGYVYIRLNGLTVGQSYLISVTFDNNATLDAGYNARIDHNNGSSNTVFTHWNKTNAGSETLTGLFTAQTANSEYFALYANAITLNVSNFIVRAVDDEDRSVNNKGLQVFGTITKSAVATGAELVKYGGFDTTSNYLEQPYNSNLTFGTNDFSVMCWYYNDSSTEIRVQRTTGGADGWALTLGNADEDFYIHNGNFSTFAGFTDLTKVGAWTHFTIIRRYNDKWYVYKNGELAVTTTTLASNNFNDTGTFKVHAPSGSSANSIALLRVSQSVPSPDQIKKIYEDEKVLFQENSKCTLYGTSSAVTALAYDDSTNLLYAGTSSGRSDFQGLRRINNTTTAVTTAMSASNGLVAEQ